MQWAAVSTMSPFGLATTLAEQKCPSSPWSSVANSAPTTGRPLVLFAVSCSACAEGGCWVGAAGDAEVGAGSLVWVGLPVVAVFLGAACPAQYWVAFAFSCCETGRMPLIVDARLHG